MREKCVKAEQLYEFSFESYDPHLQVGMVGSGAQLISQSLAFSFAIYVTNEYFLIFLPQIS